MTIQSVSPVQSAKTPNRIRGKGNYNRQAKKGCKWAIDSITGSPRQIPVDSPDLDSYACNRGHYWIIDNVTLKPRRIWRAINRYCDCATCAEEDIKRGHTFKKPLARVSSNRLVPEAK